MLVGIHSVNTTTALSQIRIGKHVADLITINHDARVYEIKSDLDNFKRLYGQLSDFYRVFSKVSILLDVNESDNVRRLLADFANMGDAIGIYCLSERDTIFGQAIISEPKPFDDFLDHTYIFKLLRKYEYQNIIVQAFGQLPQMTPVFNFSACLDLFKKLPLNKAQEMFFMELKKRNKISKIVFDRIQPELKSTVYFAHLSKKLPQLENFLKSYYNG